MSESTSRDVRAKVIRRILVVTVGVEAAVVGGYGVVLAIDSVTQKATETGAGIVLAVTAVALCAGLSAAAVAAARGRRGARAPIIVWQILQGALARDALTARSTWGMLLVGLAVLAAVGAVWPGVLGDGVDADPDASSG